MHRLFLLILAIAVTQSVDPASNPSFKLSQMRFERVRLAAAHKEPVLKRLFAERKLNYPPARILIRVFKRERILEVWGAEPGARIFFLVKEYQVCATSGGPGPKRRVGDGQVPEGFYNINRFNPVSNFHLSLGLDYPNRSDRILGTRANQGGDIFIHGGCVTIGCVPITDEGIDELYVLAVEAKSAGQTFIPVHIFPARMSDAAMVRLRQDHAASKDLVDFWKNLKEGYDNFERTRMLYSVKVDRLGRYNFTP